MSIAILTLKIDMSYRLLKREKTSRRLLNKIVILSRALSAVLTSQTRLELRNSNLVKDIAQTAYIISDCDCSKELWLVFFKYH